GQVRRGLAEAGFTVRKVPGYGRKRESLTGVRTTVAHPVAAAAPDTPWDLPDATVPRPAHVLVLGGGLAGCSAAAALARRGVAVTLLEQGALAGAGSGNRQGILYTRLSHRHSALTDFALQSFWFARGCYSALFERGQLVRGVDGELCGALQQTAPSGPRAALADALHSVPELAQAVDAQRAGELLGIEMERGGYWYPGSGWLHPPAVCRALARTAGVTALEHTGALHLQYRKGQWCALAGDRTLASASCAIIATGVASATQASLDWLALQIIRGQTTHLPSDQRLSRLRAVLCHEGYIAPAREGEHCIGATFDPRDAENRLRASDHGKNLAALAAAVPAWRDALHTLDPAPLGGQVGYRCASPDYLPLVGPVPDRPAFLRDYGALRKNARQRIPNRGHYMSGLYLDTAHGSRGLTSAPLAAELLASQICGEPPPLDRQLCRALAPARFLIRDLGRGRI
ncbi:MAG: FAD-dependent 5-carboxymethylaminomethyl-2-thiouridine(34) oxidoreductase MnmC, partial [Halioglobus sp.]|nr:FAD-dependent 5-carboxymethylaminomethyl-2-thiouridine(34) oxidoreductase MnmC [Halioglobus sp.]